MKRLRVAIIGLGQFGESHVATFSGLPQVEVVAVVSRSPERAESIARTYGVSRWYTDFRTMLEDADVDAVTVATAESDHLEPVIAALRAGKAVLVEKPMATTLEDARTMSAAARASSGFLMPGHILRFEPRYAALKTTVERGELGEVVSLVSRRNRSHALVRTHRRVHPALITAIHDVDIMLWITGSRVRSVRAHHRLASQSGEAHGVWALLGFESGAAGMLETSWLIPEAVGVGGDDAFAVTGVAGTANVTVAPSAFQLWRTDGAQAPDVSYEPRIHGHVGGALRNELDYFANCALAGTAPAVVTAADGLAALIVTRAVIESAERDAEIVVEWPQPPDS